MRVSRLLLVMIWLLSGLGPAASPVAAAPDLREDLTYQISLGPWDRVALVHLRLMEVQTDHYLAEFSGAAQGMWQLLNRWLPESYQTEMVYRDGRLLPLVFREKFLYKGRHYLKEYHFDYGQKRLTLWSKTDNREREKEWEAQMDEPIYDLLSLFYNLRLGALGPLPGGSTLRVAILPNPEPQELVGCIGPETKQGRKIMLHWRPMGSTKEYPCFVYLNPEQVPTLGWARVFFFGKLQGRLLNPDEIRKDGLLSPSPAAPPTSGARR